MKDGATKANEILGQVSGKTVETMTVWAEANQRMLQQMVDLSVGAAKESVRLYAELQQGAIEAVRDGQATAMKWQTSWQDTPKDPTEWYQKALAETVDGAQKLFRYFESNAHAMTRSAERLQASAEQAGKSMQDTLEATVTRMKDTYTKN
jgi:uncharacterized protein YndB with AHSA1/START domain